VEDSAEGTKNDFRLKSLLIHKACGILHLVQKQNNQRRFLDYMGFSNEEEQSADGEVNNPGNGKSHSLGFMKFS